MVKDALGRSEDAQRNLPPAGAPFRPAPIHAGFVHSKEMRKYDFDSDDYVQQRAAGEKEHSSTKSFSLYHWLTWQEEDSQGLQAQVETCFLSYSQREDEKEDRPAHCSMKAQAESKTQKQWDVEDLDMCRVENGFGKCIKSNEGDERRGNS